VKEMKTVDEQRSNQNDRASGDVPATKPPRSAAGAGFVWGVIIVGGLAWGLVWSDGCNRKKPENYYEVVSCQAASGEWVLLHVFDAKKVRITMVCDYYMTFMAADLDQWADETKWGPHACGLRVGERLIPNLLPANPHDYLEVDERPNQRDGYGPMIRWNLFVAKDTGADHVVQGFKVIREEVVTR
jgi:hypothetical protein